MIKALGAEAVPFPLVCVDAGFFGTGLNNKPLRVGVERKKIGDMAQCILNGRYIHQAQTAHDTGFNVLCLIVEGRVRSNPDDGILEVPVWGVNPKTLRRAEIWQPVKPFITYSRFDQFLTELFCLAGILVKRSETVAETALQIKDLYVNFQKSPDKHNSLHQIYTLAPPVVQLTRPGLVRRVAKELDGIGWERSGQVAAQFKSVREMVDANQKQWYAIEGIGKKTAEKVVAELQGLKVTRRVKTTKQ